MSLYDVTPEGDDEDFEPDMATVAFLDQQQAEFEGMATEFEDTYGFKHECKCGEDYAAGRVGEITQCYHSMMQEALANCARLNAEVKEITAIAQALYAELYQREAEEGGGELSEVDSAEATTGVQAFADDSFNEPIEGSGPETDGPRNTNTEGKPSDRKLI